MIEKRHLTDNHNLRVVVQLGPDDRPEGVLAQGDFSDRLLAGLAALLFFEKLLLAILPQDRFAPARRQHVLPERRDSGASNNSSINAGLDDALEELARDVPSQLLDGAAAPVPRVGRPRGEGQGLDGLAVEEHVDFGDVRGLVPRELINSERRMPP